MDPKTKTGETTLGDLLSPDRTPTSEGEWVALVRSIAEHDESALRKLFERAHRLVFTLAMRITGAREIAEEVTLDVFQDVWSRAAKYDPADGSVVGWIMNQARSRAIDRVRFENRAKRQPRADTGTDAAAVEAPTDPVEARQRRRTVEAALGALSEEERRAIETAFFSELTYAETASRLGQPLGTVKTRIRSALSKLREVLGGAP